MLSVLAQRPTLPDTVAAGARLTAKDVLEREIAVEIRLEIRLIDRQVELVPLAAVEHELVVAAAELHQAGNTAVSSGA